MSLFFFRLVYTVSNLNQLINPFLPNTTYLHPLKQSESPRRSHRRCSIKKAVLNNYALFTGKYLCRSLFLIKLPCSFIKKRLQHSCFPWNIAKFFHFRNTNFEEHQPSAASEAHENLEIFRSFRNVTLGRNGLISY